LVTEDQPSIAALERARLTAVQAQRVAFDGSFVVRGFLGGTGRANAASSLSPEADPELSARSAEKERAVSMMMVPATWLVL
jgi:hypothetical protein